MDNSHQFVYVYDTEKKIEDYFKKYERGFSEKTGLPPETHEVKEFMAMVREQGQPLVTVGPFAVFVNDDGTFSVCEIQSAEQEQGLLLPLVELETGGQSKRLVLSGSQEKGGRLPRFRALFFYSDDGVYEKGSFAVHRDDGTMERIYFDSKGIGFFDVMYVFENDAQVTYHLNGLSWERVDEQPLTESYKSIKDTTLEYRDRYQAEHNISNDKQDVGTEQIGTSEALDDATQKE